MRVLALLLAAAPALAQEPSEAERASEATRALTEAEEALRAEGCERRIAATEDEVTLFGVQFPVVTLPEVSALRLFEILVPAPAGEADVRPLPVLPFGGIGPRDLCEFALLRYEGTALPGAAEAVGSAVLILRRDLDLLADYPTTGAEIERRGQVLSVPPGAYAALRGEGAEPALERLRAADEPRHDRSRPAILLGENPLQRPDFILIPVRGD